MNIYHPILAAVFPILFFYSQNQDELRPGVVGEPLGLAIGIALVMWLAASLVYRSMGKGSLMTTLLLGWFFFYGHVTYVLRDIFIPIGGVVLGPDKILFPTSIGLVVFLGVFISKKAYKPEGVNGWLNWCLAILTIIQLVTILPRERVISQVEKMSDKDGEQATSGPDVYFLVLDAYARGDVLQQIYEYDNSQFLDELKQVGMVVVDDARSNYSQTFFSLAATLNMEHVNNLKEDPGAGVSVPLRMIGENQVARKFKENGYRVINLASGWEVTDNLPVADINYNEVGTFKIFGRSISVNEFLIVFIKTTALSPFVDRVLADQARAKVLYAFAKLEEIPYQRGRKFVIGHFNVPHPPYLFDQNGDPIPNQLLELAGESFSDRENYLKQLGFVSQKTLEVIRAIINNSDQPPIIILQSDHGPASILGHPYKWTRPAARDGVMERMSILSAYYLPMGIDTSLVPKTPVNTFRFIFNEYFGDKYEMLEETSYFSDYSSIFEFFEVEEFD